MNLARLQLVALAAVLTAAVPEEKKEEKKWDVTEPIGPTTPLSF